MQGTSPLVGKRVVVTRARSQASELCRLVEARGGLAYEFPVIRIAWPEEDREDDWLNQQCGQHSDAFLGR